jgi:hypothetical protein
VCTLPCLGVAVALASSAVCVEARQAIVPAVCGVSPQCTMCRPRKGKGPSSGHGAPPGMPRPRNVAPPAGPAPPAGYYEHHPMHMMPPYTVGMPPVSLSQVERWLQPMSGHTG